MEKRSTRYPVPQSAAGLARRTATGVLVAVVALLVVTYLVEAAGVDVGDTGPMSPFSTIPLVGSAVVAGAGAAVVYALAVRRASRPVRAFVLASAVVFVLMLVPTVVVAPGLGVTPVGQAVLVLCHVLVAVPLVAFIAGAV